MQTSSTPSLSEEVRRYGCSEVVLLDPDSPRPQLDYLDLLPDRLGGSNLQLGAVAEHQGAARLFLVDARGEALVDAGEIRNLQRLLANRSDCAWLGVVSPGSLAVYPIAFSPETSDATLTVERADPRAPLLFQCLVHGALEHEPPGVHYVYQRILELLTRTSAALVGQRELEPLEVLSLAGRALFFRFLIDRQVVLPTELAEICPGARDLRDVFTTPELAAQTCAWLDETFNGDFLPLIDESIPTDDRLSRRAAYLAYHQRAHVRTGGKVQLHLQAILRGWQQTGPAAFQGELDWGDLDFAHIPIGVLSQVYETFSHLVDPRSARATSVHYTPRTIAQLVVDEVFAGVSEPAAARVLDPACGAGIFLALAFRRLLRERWLQDGKRPTAEVIQRILYDQLRGFEINESALRLAALTLYFTAIEVNAEPRPPRSLRFPRPLRDEVLFCFGQGRDGGKAPPGARSASAFRLGALDPEVPASFDGQFDIVIGNPPWTRLREDHEPEGGSETETDAPSVADKRKKRTTEEFNVVFTRIGREALTRRGLVEQSRTYRNPDKNPDLPFLWQATRWAREGGHLGLVMPARIFQRASGLGRAAWLAVLDAVSITGLVNGADLRKTSVWEDVDVPFCLLFARNERPPEGHRFLFAAPRFEPTLNRVGRFRIDYEAARPVSQQRIIEQPWVLKTLSLGTWLDVELVERLQAEFQQTIGEYWKKWDKKLSRIGKGYDLSPKLRQKDAPFLGRLPDFQPGSLFSIQNDKLCSYFNNHGRASASMPRTEALYQPPLVIIRQSIGGRDSAPRAYYSEQALAFSQSYYGFSCAGHPEQETLAALLYLLPHSRLFTYLCLMTSIRVGFDRQTFNLEDMTALPFPDPAALAASDKVALRDLATRLRRDDDSALGQVDELISRLYRVEDEERALIRDTLYSAALDRKKALDEELAPPGRAEDIEPFLVELRQLLDPFFEVCGKHLLVDFPPFPQDRWRTPWTFLALARSGRRFELEPALLQAAMAEANRLSASRVIVESPSRDGLLLGVLNQRRWWTLTRARLCAQHILRRHLGAFGLEDAQV